MNDFDSGRSDATSIPLYLFVPAQTDFKKYQANAMHPPDMTSQDNEGV
jgi:hypothetical protein